MSKVYIIVSVQGSTGQVAGLFGPDDPLSVDRWGVDGPAVRYRDAAPELREQVRNAVDEKFPDDASYLMSEMGDSAFLFTRRKAAREVLANLNEDVTWEWRIIECGPPAARDMRPVLGWQIMCLDHISAHNPEDGAGMFPTRAAARAYSRGDGSGVDLRQYKTDGVAIYTIQPVYGAYRVDPKYPGDTRYIEGSLRFRTKADAVEFARRTYYTGQPSSLYQSDIPYRVVLHDEPVSESLLWDIEA